MFVNKMKAITFSYDDGVEQDIRLINILNKYNLKATFNINSELLGMKGYLKRFGVDHNKVNSKDVKSIYQGHEVAVHTLTHPNLTQLDRDEEIIRQVEMDRLNLSQLVGYDVIGMAYPCGGVNNDQRVAELIKNNTGVKYSRTITSNNSFDIQDNLFRFNPTVHHMKMENMLELAVRFIELKADKPQIFYIWGHSYEFDIDNTWDSFEEFCKIISNKKDIFYGTNKEILLAK